eukprot:1160040-Pelagomonas_calceolata.AAC.3
MNGFKKSHLVRHIYRPGQCHTMTCVVRQMQFGALIVGHAWSPRMELAGSKHVENVATGIDCYSIRQPLGVRERD